MLTLRAPAKLNLGLEIRARRPDGYHEIDTIFLPLRLFDQLTLELGPGSGIEFECDDAGLPTGDENLAVRAVRAAS